MDQLLFVLGELLFEVLIEVFGQLLIEFGLRGISATSQKRHSPVYAFFGYVMLGTICGGLSILFVSDPVITNEFFGMIHLLVAPVVAGLFMSVRRKLLIKKGKVCLRINSFVYGYSFALAFAAVRFYLVN